MTQHAYRLGLRGRSIKTRPGVGGVTITARLQCSTCPKVGELPLRMIMPPDQIDKKFAQAGWSVDPHTCVDCQRTPKKGTAVSSKPSVAAMKTQAQMFTLLSTHFDADNGRYGDGWSDKKIATDTGLAPDFVAEFRRAGFGEIKEPAEIARLRADISAVEQLARESQAAIVEQVAALRGQLAKITRDMPA